MKYIIILALLYLGYKYIKPLLPKIAIRKSEKSESNTASSLNIREEDIQDAEFEDVNDTEEK
jgi:hypothetical protein